MAIFKRNANIGVGVGEQNSKVLEEIVDNFTVLITSARFLNVCQARFRRGYWHTDDFMQSDKETSRQTGTKRLFV